MRIVNSNLHKYLEKALLFGSRVSLLYFNFMHCSLSYCSVCHNDTCKITHKPNRAFCSIVYHLNSSNNVAKFKIRSILFSFFFHLQGSWKSLRKLEKSQDLLFIKLGSVDCEILINFQFVIFFNLKFM